MEEIPCVITNGRISSRLPFGYKFRPTGIELLYYLRGKTLYPTVRAPNFLPEFDISKAEPWMLPGIRREAKFFFSMRKNFAYGNTCNRIAGSGYWKYTGEFKEIMDDERNNLVVGVRKTLIFNEGKHSQGPRNTIWVMYEFCLVGTPKASHSSQIIVGDWAIFYIFWKRKNLKRKRSDDDEELNNGNKRQRLEEYAGYDINPGSPTYNPFSRDIEVEDISSPEWDSDTSSPTSGYSGLSE